MENRYTQGPWKVEEEYNILWIWGSRNKKGNRELVTHIPTHLNEEGAQKEKLEANAKLIAAAPELLEALMSIENDDKTIPEAIWNMRNAAIEKVLA